MSHQIMGCGGNGAPYELTVCMFWSNKIEGGADGKKWRAICGGKA
jgi:hypothetical protein